MAIATGLRISDVLSIETDKLRDKNGELGNRNRITVRELKTGKNRRVYLPNELLEKMIRIAGKYYVFEGRINPKKHRTRQAVAKDMKRARQILRAKKLVVSPHTAPENVGSRTDEKRKRHKKTAKANEPIATPV